MSSISAFPPLKDRAIKDTLVLFDVDGTLTPARQDVSQDMLTLLQKLRTQVAIGFVGGSDLPKQQEQLATNDVNVVDLFDYAFAENGLTAYREGKQMGSESFISWIGEEKYKKLAKFILHYIADLDIPVQRGTFIEFRNGMINVSPIGRNATIQERHDFEAYDKIHHVRRDMVNALKKNFPDLAVTYSIGGQISFDVFPTGWDKTYCLRHVEADGWKHIHFFGDKTYQGGNDYEIYNDERVIGHAVTKPEDTMKLLNELFLDSK